MTVEGILEIIERDIIFYDQSGGGVTFSGGEPLEQLDFLDACLAACRERSIATAVDTSGYCTPDDLISIEDDVTLFLYDLKTVDDACHRSVTGVSNESILENLRGLDSRGRPFVVRIPVIPGVNDDDEQIDATIDFLTALQSNPEVHLLPYHRLGVSKARTLRTTARSVRSYCFDSDRFDAIYRTFSRRGIKVKTGG